MLIVREWITNEISANKTRKKCRYQRRPCGRVMTATTASLPLSETAPRRRAAVTTPPSTAGDRGSSVASRRTDPATGRHQRRRVVDDAVPDGRVPAPAPPRRRRSQRGRRASPTTRVE